MSDREVGVQTTTHSCGTELKAVDQPDGGVAYEPCPKCYKPASKKETAAAAKTARELGTNLEGDDA